MAFSSSSFFAGVGTAFIAVALGFAGGALVTTSAVQPPNRLERVTSKAPPPPSAPSPTTEQPTAPSEVSAPSGPPPAPSQKADSQPAPQPQAALAVTGDAANKKDAATAEPQRAATLSPSATQPIPTANQDNHQDTAAPKNERASARSDSKRETYRRRYEERKFSERKRRQDLDDAANAARQTRRDDGADPVVVERDSRPRYVEEQQPRYVEERPPRSGFFGFDDGAPRGRGDAPSPFGFFGNN
jgi:hypothetical protein